MYVGAQPPAGNPRAYQRRPRRIGTAKHERSCADPRKISGARKTVEGALHACGALLQDVGVDHGGLEIGVAEELLHGSDANPGFEKVGREGVAEGVA